MPTELDYEAALERPYYTPRPSPTPIPGAAWNEEPTYCLKVNDEWASHLLGVMEALDQDDTWLGTAEERDDARAQVNELMAALMEQCEDESMSDRPIRLAADGTVESQNEIGDWVADLSSDPREHIPLNAPVFLYSTDPNYRATAALVVTQQFINQLALHLAAVDAAPTVSIAPVIYQSLIPAGIVEYAPENHFFQVIAAQFGDVMIGTDTTGFAALFDDAAWTDFACAVYCNMEADGSMTQAQWLALKNHCHTYADGRIIWFDLMLNLLGRKGIANYGKLVTVWSPIVTFPDDCTCE